MNNLENKICIAKEQLIEKVGNNIKINDLMKLFKIKNFKKLYNKHFNELKFQYKLDCKQNKKNKSRKESLDSIKFSRKGSDIDGDNIYYDYLIDFLNN